MPLEALQAAASDRRSGSALVATAAARALADLARSASADEEVLEACRTLVRAQPLMAACLRLADRVVRALEEGGRSCASEAAGEFARLLLAEQAAVARALADALPAEGTVVTVSASSVVVRALQTRPALRVVCALSEPGGEGRDACEALRAAGMDAVLVPDGALAQQSARADAVVFGADAVGPDALLNKTGTLAAALGACTARRPCLCAAGSTKLVGDELWPHLREAAERRLGDGIPVFEEVPLALLTAVVSEGGPASVRAVRRAARGQVFHELVGSWMAG